MNDVLVLVPPWVAYLLGAVVVLLASRRVGTVVAVALAALTVPWILAAPTGAGPTIAPLGFEQVPVRIDGLSRPVAALFGFVAALNVLYGYATEADVRQSAYSLVYMSAGVAVVLAGDWLTLLVAWELLAVSATILLWHHGGDAVRPAFRYAIYHLVGGAFLVGAIALHYATAGTFVDDGGFTEGLPTVLALAGVGVNLGFIGLHAWLPETYSRPHVTTTVVLAGFTTKVAVYALARLALDGNAVVAWLGAVMVFYGVTQAILQTDMRRLLSYHIISQLGYMIVALDIGTAAGLAGAFAHLTANVLYKGLLFMVAGAIIVRTGETSLKRLGGLAWEMPVVFGTFLIAALAITGVPGFSGFVSKGLVMKAVENAGADLLWWVLVLGSVGTALSFAKFGYYAFVRRAPEPLSVAPSRITLSTVLVVIALPSILFGILPEVFLGLFAGDADGFEPYAASELAKALVVAAAGVGAFALFRTRLARIQPVDVDRVLHPVAAAATTSTAALAVRVGSAATVAGEELTGRLGSLAGRDPEIAETTLHTALLALITTTAVALLVAALA
ncbi:proton-conducting transporter transmembrane domain-containing protein [Halococcus hamelinensis]|uniref:Monovalent cation/H+ antiporter subunit D n=1 Tax=Halococcus hamelinensis 100A6 TaxID=1132509 RepID=M0M8B0_9EURY|nr:proton-conducting transporter membrane subunit [Halococcus hamelinensis]EMA42042.1 monovalent cation/H+ antiporter subunit D [Halococcus hamelinensis 100A6]